MEALRQFIPLLILLYLDLSRSMKSFIDLFISPFLGTYFKSRVLSIDKQTCKVVRNSLDFIVPLIS